VKVLVTGANGFVGSRMVKRLSEAGHEVRAGYGADAPGPARNASVGGNGPVRWFPLDITDLGTVAKFVSEGCDALVHLAGMASVRQANADPSASWAVNAQGAAQVALALAEARRATGSDPLLLVVSSAEVYSPASGRPHRETDLVGPASPYAASKLGAELAALQTWRSAGLRVVVARPFPHIGRGQAVDFWVARRCRVLVEAKRRGAPAVTVGELSPVRDFLHVDDVVDAYMALLTHGRAGEIYNIASGCAVTLAAVHAKLEELIGIHPLHERDAEEMRPDARPYLVGDASKLRSATGWTPWRSLEETLKEVVDAQAD
jgi:GDP-4-dehydro-6-deoxy-D-mannose reductase